MEWVGGSLVKLIGVVSVLESRGELSFRVGGFSIFFRVFIWV